MQLINFLLNQQILVLGENNEEISKTSQDAKNCSKNLDLEEESIQSDNEVPSNKKHEQINSDVSKNITDELPDSIAHQHNSQDDGLYNENNSEKFADTNHNRDDNIVQTVVASDGTPTEVTMRRQTRKYSQKTASFRWSGTEMLQVDGPQAVVGEIENEITEVVNKSFDNTRANISYKNTNALLTDRLNSLGFHRQENLSDLPRDGDNCFKALLDQMSQPNQDFKVWEKDDFSFLRWYIVKQLEIHIAADRADHFIHKNHTGNTDHFINTLQKDNSYIDNQYLYSVSKVFNKDIIVFDSGKDEDVLHIKGGVNGSTGKGSPLFLAHLKREDVGQDYYQSIVPDENMNIDIILNQAQTYE